MQLQYLTILLPLVLACKQQTGKSIPENAVTQDSLTTKQTEVNADSGWLEKARQMAEDSLQMTDDFLLVSGDTVAWPWPAKQKTKTAFSNGKQNIVVTPASLSQLNMELSYQEPGGKTVTEALVMQLHPAYYLAAEIADDPKTGESLPFVLYEAKSGNKNYRLLISINETGPRYAMCTVFVEGKGAPALQTNLLAESKS